MVERDGRLVFGAGSVCFPNRWDLRSKLGLTLADVHAPVAPPQRSARGPDRRLLRSPHARAQLLASRVGRARHRRLVHADRRHGGAPPGRPDTRPSFTCASSARRCAGSRDTNCRAVHDPHLRDADPVGRRRPSDVARRLADGARRAARPTCGPTRIVASFGDDRWSTISERRTCTNLIHYDSSLCERDH